MQFFVPNGGVGTVSRIDDGVIRQGEDFFANHLYQQVVASSRQVAASHTSLKNEVATNHKLIGRIIQGNAAVAMPRRVEHLQALVAKTHLITLLQKKRRRRHLIHGKSKSHSIRIRFVIDGHAGLMAPNGNIERVGTPSVTGNVINVRMRVYHTFNRETMSLNIFFKTLIFKCLTIPRIHNQRLTGIVMQNQRVYLYWVEMKNLNRHVLSLLSQVPHKFR